MVGLAAPTHPTSFRPSETEQEAEAGGVNRAACRGPFGLLLRVVPGVPGGDVVEEVSWSEQSGRRAPPDRESALTIFVEPPALMPVLPLPPGPRPNVVLVLPGFPVVILYSCVVIRVVDERSDGRGVFHEAQGHARPIDQVVILVAQAGDEIGDDFRVPGFVQAFQATQPHFLVRVFDGGDRQHPRGHRRVDLGQRLGVKNADVAGIILLHAGGHAGTAIGSVMAAMLSRPC